MLYQHLVKILNLGCAKGPALADRNWVHIDLILTQLRSANAGDFRTSPNLKFSLDAGMFIQTSKVNVQND